MSKRNTQLKSFASNTLLLIVETLSTKKPQMEKPCCVPGEMLCQACMDQMDSEEPTLVMVRPPVHIPAGVSLPLEDRSATTYILGGKSLRHRFETILGSLPTVKTPMRRL